LRENNDFFEGFAFIQYQHSSSAVNAINNENGSTLADQTILVKAAEMKRQKHKLSACEIRDNSDEPTIKSECNTFLRMMKFYSNVRLTEHFSEFNSMSSMNELPNVNHCEIIVISGNLM
jgi:RNA recognition motif-containing protein